VLLTEADRPVLLDFGAARRVIGDRTQALTAILKPNFAPIEQYADVTTIQQGPWTDLYGLAATVYFLLTAKPPLPAAARALNDELVPLAQWRPAGCSLPFLQAIDWALALRPNDRPRNVAQWRDALDGRIAVPAPPRAASVPPPTEGQGHAGDEAPFPATLVYTPRGPDAAPPFANTAPGPLPGYDETAAAATAAAAAAAAAGRPAGRRALRMGGVALALLLVAGIAVGVLRARTAPVVVADMAAAPAPAASADALGQTIGREPGTGRALIVEKADPVPAPRASASDANAAGSAVAVASPPAPPPALPAPPSQGTPAPAPARPPAARGAGSRHAAAEERAQARAPSATCGNRMFLVKLICMKHECSTDRRVYNHPECVQMRETERRRENY
jgi:hypothetical protein